MIPEATIGPLLLQMSLGGVLGFCAGYAVKKVGKIVAIFIGLAFVLLQVLAYYEVVAIDLTPISRWWNAARQEGQLENAWSVVSSVLFANVAGMVGAVPGFVLGLRRG